eukprot:524189-Rhodomonas_salina.1
MQQSAREVLSPPSPFVCPQGGWPIIRHDPGPNCIKCRPPVLTLALLRAWIPPSVPLVARIPPSRRSRPLILSQRDLGLIPGRVHAFKR